MAANDKALYSLAVKAAKTGNRDVAFVNFRRIMFSYPKSRYRHDALFAVGEYSFSIKHYSQAAQSFVSLINEYPDSELKLFVQAYLAEIARIDKKALLVKKLEKDIVASQQISLLFRDSEEYKRSSPLGKEYKAVYFIDKIEFYIDENLFAQVAY